MLHGGYPAAGFESKLRSRDFVGWRSGFPSAGSGQALRGAQDRNKEEQGTNKKEADAQYAQDGSERIVR